MIQFKTEFDLKKNYVATQHGRVAYCEFICNRLHLSGTVLSLEAVASVVILIQGCGEPGFDSDVHSNVGAAC